MRLSYIKEMTDLTPKKINALLKKLFVTVTFILINKTYYLKRILPTKIAKISYIVPVSFIVSRVAVRSMY